MQPPRPLVLSNKYVTLQPLSVDEAAAYQQIGADVQIWAYLTPEPLRTRADALCWIESMQTRGASNGDITFSVYDKATGQLAGTSSYLDVRTEHGGLEIGFTWYGVRYQRTHVNTATKLALFEHAFEELGAVRVQLQTDLRNLRSQRAIERLGAYREGVLRKHKTYPDGFVRDSVMYSVTSDDWVGVKSRLWRMLQAR